MTCVPPLLVAYRNSQGKHLVAEGVILNHVVETVGSPLMNVPEDLVYSEDHHWLRPESGNRARLGITEYAQDALGEIAFVDLPVIGSTVGPGDPIGEVESSKSVSEVVAPVAGEVVEVNDVLESSPGRINEDPYGDGWVCVLALADPQALGLLIGAETYRSLIDG